MGFVIMHKKNEEEIRKRQCSREWKEKNIEYLREIEKFFDIVDNILDEKLKLDVIYQMLKCDEILTKIAEERLEDKV